MIFPRTALAYAAVGLAGMMAVTAQPAGVPVATLVAGTTTMCSAAGVEYSGRWSIPGNGILVGTLEECAAMCEADPQCTGATWIGFEPAMAGSVDNCYFKAWDPAAAAVPCQPTNLPEGRTYAALITLPTGDTDCADITYLPDMSIDCIEEKEVYGEFSGSALAVGLPAAAPEVEIVEGPEAIGPVAIAPVVEPTGAVEVAITGLDTLDPPYIAYTGADYSPNQMPPPAVPVENVMTGFVAESVVECATACNDDPACNAASYYGNNPMDTWPGGFTCWIKTLGVPCELPADYEATELPDTVFLLAQENCGVVAPMAALPGMAPDMGPAMAPLETLTVGAPTPGPIVLGPVAGPVLPPVAALVPSAAPEAIRDFDINLSPTGVATTPAASPGAPVAVDPITGPVLTTDVPGPAIAPGPVDAGTGIGIGGTDTPALDDTASQEATTIDGVADGALGLSTALSTVAAVAAAVCLMA